jgi:type IV pilus assembly protein PilV
MRTSHARRQNGVSIVEALVALLVLSIGLLGIAVMYLESVRSNRTALTRTLAVHLVNDMADRIRANRAAKDTYTLVAGTPPTGPAPNCATADCTAAQLATYDMIQWYTAVTTRDAGLPVGPDGTAPQVQISYLPGATGNDPGRYTIVAKWKDTGSTAFLSTQLEFTVIGTT